MRKELDVITIGMEDGEEEFYVLETTRLMGVNYYLVAEADDYDRNEEVTCLILRENENGLDEEYGMFSFVEDEEELNSLSKIFDELMEDDDTEVRF